MSTVERIIELCKARSISLRQLEADLHYGNGYIGKASAIKDDRLVEIADYLNVSVDELLGRENSYYMDDEVIHIAQELKERPQMKILFDATRDVSPADLDFIIQMVNKLGRS